MRMYDNDEGALERANKDLAKTPRKLLEEMYRLVHTDLIREDERAPHHASAKFAALLVILAEQSAKESAANTRLQRAVKILTIWIFVLTLVLTVLAFFQVRAAYTPARSLPQPAQQP